MKHFTVLHKLFSERGGDSFIKLFSLLFLVSITLTTLQAQNVITHNIGTQGNLVIPGNSTDDYIITGTTTVNTVTVSSGYGFTQKRTITLRNLNITSSKAGTAYGMSGVSCITVEGAYDRSNMDPITKVDFILEGTNTLTYTMHCFCAFQVNQGAQIHINAINPNNNASGTLVAKNTAATGPLNPIALTSGGGGAAIGAPNFDNATNNTGQGTASTIICTSGSGARTTTAGGNIIIGSGTITAEGGHAAGIGGGWYTYYNGVIIVYGGNVTASCRRHAAGIGSGCPNGSGVTTCSAENSATIALLPAQISGYGKNLEGDPNDPTLALTGARNTTYMNDPNKSLITVKTEDEEPDADIFLDLTETPNLVYIFGKLGVDIDLKKLKIGKTGTTSKVFQFRAEFKENTTFFTDASSSKPATLGRPYMPFSTTVTAPKTIILPLLGMDIAFTDYPSKPLELGYDESQAKQNAYRLKMEYKDAKTFTDVTFQLQDLGADFLPMTFYASDGITVVPTPTTLHTGDVYFLDLPIKEGKPIGVYSEILQIHGVWDSRALPGPIRRIGEQRVVYNDTDKNVNIKVTASQSSFVEIYPTTKSINLTLNINHTGNPIIYNPLDVTAKYLLTTEPDYEAALAATPLSSWTNMNVPANVSTDMVTPVSFTGKPRDTYYIHWYVVSGVVYAHSGTITVPPRPCGGFGPYVITDAVTAGTLSGNPSVCIGQTPSEIKGEVSTGGSGSFDYQWQKSTNGTTWTNVGGNTVNYTPDPLTVSPTYYQRLTTDNQYGGTALPSDNVFKIYIVNDGQTLYWKRNATNRNWNDPTNWTDAGGVVQNMVPVSCSNVYIPGGAANYPSLDLDGNVTPTNVYGPPICHNITFGYGAELAYQHNLTYDSVYVQYNFGYYSPLISGVQPTANKDGGSGISMKRDQWYPLAAPLKKMASGDFAFGGYPFIWQALADVVSGEDNFYSINFNKAYANNDVDLSTTNNSIAVKAALYKTGTNTTGYNNHKNLQALQGVLEIPYFNNSSEAPYHPGHSYDPIAESSMFYYFNSTTLQRLNNPVGKMDRGDKAFRFVIENDQDKIETVTIDGVNVPCYTMKVSPNNTHKHALIGNPFMAAINMKNFYDVNAGVLYSDAGYYAYDNSGTGTWKNYTYTLGNGVNSFQAFVVVFNNSAANQILRFPLEGGYALTGTTTAKIPRRILQAGALNVKVSNESGLGGDYAELSPVNYIVENDLTSDVRKLIGEESHTTPEVFFINNNTAAYNLMQIYKRGEMVVDLGIRCSDTESVLTLSFDKIQEFAQLTGRTPVLVDAYQKIEQDLTQNNTYIFKQQLTDGSNNKYTDASRLSIHLGDPVSTSDDGINVFYQQGNLTVKSTKEIEKVKVYNMLGQLIFDSKILKENGTYYRQAVSLPKGSYVVRVNTADNKSVSRKIMAAEY